MVWDVFKLGSLMFDFSFSQYFKEHLISYQM